jgi:hypothetical protein
LIADAIERRCEPSGIFYGPLADIAREISPGKFSNSRDARNELSRLREVIRKGLAQELAPGADGPTLIQLEDEWVDSEAIETMTGMKGLRKSEQFKIPWILYVKTYSKYSLEIEIIAESVAGTTGTKPRRNPGLFELYFLLAMRNRGTENLQNVVEWRVKSMARLRQEWFPARGAWTRLHPEYSLKERQPRWGIALPPGEALATIEEWRKHLDRVPSSTPLRKYPEEPSILEAPEFAYRDDVLRQLSQFLHAADGSSLFLLVGGPGSGKSTILQTLLKLEKRCGREHHHIFIRMNDGERNVPSRILEHLAASIAPELNSSPDRHSPVSAGEAVELFREALSTVSPSKHLTIIIDGIDESYGNDRKQPPLVKLLRQFVPDERVKFVVSSRMAVDIDKLKPTICIDLNDGSEQEGAIERFFLDSLGNLQLDPQVFKKLIEIAGGSFLMASILARHARDENGRMENDWIPGSVSECLEEEWDRVYAGPLTKTNSSRVLSIIAAYRDSLTVDLLSALAVIPLPEVVEFFEHHAYFFHIDSKVGGGIESSARILGFRHALLRENLVACKLGQGGLQQGHSIAADHYLPLFDAIPESSFVIENDYLLRHLPYHLAEAGRLMELHHLVVSSAAWMSASLRLGEGYRVFLEHVELLKACLPACDRSSLFPHLQTLLVQCAAEVGLSRAQRPSAAALLTRLGRARETLSSVRLLDPDMRVESPIAMARVERISDNDKAGALELMAADFAHYENEQIDDRELVFYAIALARLNQKENALRIIRRISSELTKVETLTKIFDRLGPDAKRASELQINQLFNKLRREEAGNVPISTLGFLTEFKHENNLEEHLLDPLHEVLSYYLEHRIEDAVFEIFPYLIRCGDFETVFGAVRKWRHLGFKASFQTYGIFECINAFVDEGEEELAVRFLHDTRLEEDDAEAYLRMAARVAASWIKNSKTSGLELFASILRSVFRLRDFDDSYNFHDLGEVALNFAESGLLEEADRIWERMSSLPSKSGLSHSTDTIACPIYAYSSLGEVEEAFRAYEKYVGAFRADGSIDLITENVNILLEIAYSARVVNDSSAASQCLIEAQKLAMTLSSKDSIVVRAKIGLAMHLIHGDDLDLCTREIESEIELLESPDRRLNSAAYIGFMRSRVGPLSEARRTLENLSRSFFEAIDSVSNGPTYDLGVRTFEVMNSALIDALEPAELPSHRTNLQDWNLRKSFDDLGFDDTQDVILEYLDKIRKGLDSRLRSAIANESDDPGWIKTWTGNIESLGRSVDERRETWAALAGTNEIEPANSTSLLSFLRRAIADESDRHLSPVRLAQRIFECLPDDMDLTDSEKRRIIKETIRILSWTSGECRLFSDEGDHK